MLISSGLDSNSLAFAQLPELWKLDSLDDAGALAQVVELGFLSASTYQLKSDL